MILPKVIVLADRLKLEARLKETHPPLLLDFSPAFNHYYITDKETKEKSGNISLYELYTRVASGEFK